MNEEHVKGAADNVAGKTLVASPATRSLKPKERSTG